MATDQDKKIEQCLEFATSMTSVEYKKQTPPPSLTQESRDPMDALAFALNRLSEKLRLTTDTLKKKEESEARLRAELNQSEARFKTIFKHAPLGIAMIDSLTGKIYEANPKYAETLGRTEEEITDLDWMKVTHPDDIQKDLDQMALLNSGKITGFKMKKRYLRPDGSIVWISMAIAPIQVADKTHPLHLCMVEDITEAKRMEQELLTALEARDEFVSIASHELKTPLTALLLELQLLSKFTKDADLDQSLNSLIQMALRDSEKLSNLINELLDITRIRAGKLQLNLDRVDLRSKVLDLASHLSEICLNSGSKIEVIADAPVYGRWDPLRIEQIIMNILSNAIKYGEGKPISIKVYTDYESNKAILLIKDHGMGIPLELQDQIFLRFERGIVEGKIAGLGLGLYIAKQLIEAHQGSIRVDSEPHQGSLFTIELPLESVPSA